jgi:hypothetical protein
MQRVSGCNHEPIEDVAARLESDLALLAALWADVPDAERPAVLGRMRSVAPGVAGMLCPEVGRFSR